MKQSKVDCHKWVSFRLNEPMNDNHRACDRILNNRSRRLSECISIEDVLPHVLATVRKRQRPEINVLGHGLRDVGGAEVG